MEKVDTLANRLKRALELREMRKTDVASKLNINKSALTHYTNGLYEPKHDILIGLSKLLNVNWLWLAGYDVDIAYVEPWNENEEVNTQIKQASTEKMRIALNLVSMLNDENLDMIIPILRKISGE